MRQRETSEGLRIPFALACLLPPRSSFFFAPYIFFMRLPRNLCTKIKQMILRGCIASVIIVKLAKLSAVVVVVVAYMVIKNIAIILYILFVVVVVVFLHNTAPGPPEKLTCRITDDKKVHVKWDPPEDNLFLYSVVGYILQSSSGEIVCYSLSFCIVKDQNHRTALYFHLVYIFVISNGKSILS